jgi:alpha-glucosidase
MTQKEKEYWWKGGAIYQIYPRSFYDSNSDGIGDLKGITEKLDYVADLGVESVWISPFFMSPMKDFGYDVSNFKEVDPIFGNMEDFDELLEKAHSLNLKVIIDLVCSHTSDQHEWFQQSCRDKDSVYADWYVWADPKPDGSPPSNWQSVFGGSAWTFNAKRGQYYLHNFLSEQPDLNFHNEAVCDEVKNTMRFWLDKGVDGFRLDVVNFYFHDEQFRDNPPKDGNGNGCIQYEGLWPYTMQQHIYDKSRPENIPFLESVRSLLDEYDDRFLVGEIGDDKPFDIAAEYTAGDHRLHTAYSTAMMAGQSLKITAKDISGPVKEEKSINGDSWPCWAYCNHDVTRVATRWEKNNPDGNPNFTKMLMASLVSLRGSFCIYQGEELGLREAELKFEHLTDPWGIATWPEWQGRDGCRTPMPWNEFQSNAGFSAKEGMPWLPVCRKHYPMAVRQQELDPESMLNFTKSFLKWRRDHSTFRHGEIEFIDYGNDLLCFKRYDDNHEYFCIFNLTDREERVEVDTYKNAVYEFESSFNGSSIVLGSFGFCILLGD